MIRSVRDPAFQQLLALTESQGITTQARALVCGKKIVQELLGLESLAQQCEILVSAASGASPSANHTLAGMSQRHPTLLAPHLFDKLDVCGTHAPILVSPVSLPAPHPPPSLPDGCSVFLALQSPENLGAALRSCVAFGAAAVLLGPGCANPFLPRAIRASAGASLKAPPMYATTLDEFHRMDPDCPRVYLDRNSSTVLGNFDFPRKFVLVLGAEGPGLAAHHRAAAKSFGVAIEMEVALESINATVALAIALHAAYQSRSPGHG